MSGRTKGSVKKKTNKRKKVINERKKKTEGRRTKENKIIQNDKVRHKISGDII